LNLLHEKSHELSKFGRQESKSAKEELLGDNYSSPTESNEQSIRNKIDRLLRKTEENQPDDFHTNESVKKGRRVRTPRLREPQVL